MTNYIGIDIGGTAIKYALLTENAQISKAGKMKTPNTLAHFISSIKEIQAIYQQEETAGIAISMPGIIDTKTGHAVHGGALQFIRDCNIRSLLTEACQTTVHIENDGKCAALGEQWQGKLAHVDTGITLVLGTGIGGGIIVHGKILHGAHLSAGEFSFIQTNPHLPGMESIFAYQNSVQLLVHHYALQKGLDDTAVDGKIFFQAVAEQDHVAINLLDQYCENLVRQLFNLQTIIDPEIITIGGGISKQDILYEVIDTKINQLIERAPLPIVKPNVVKSALGNQANLIGALANFLTNEKN